MKLLNFPYIHDKSKKIQNNYKMDYYFTVQNLKK